MITRKLALTCAIPIHHPNLLAAGSVRNEDNTGSDEALAAKLCEDISRKAMARIDSTRFVKRSSVYLPKNLRLL